MTSLYREPEAREEVAPAALELVDVFKIYRSGPVETRSIGTPASAAMRCR